MTRNGDLAGSPTYEGWRAFATRTGTVAAIGAGIGWALSLDVDWASAASRRECAGQSGICFGAALPEGVLAGIVAVVAGCWIGFAVVGVRPLYVTVPTGIVVLLFSMILYLRTGSGGRLHPVWLFALVTGAVLAGLAALFLFVRPHPRTRRAG